MLQYSRYIVTITQGRIDGKARQFPTVAYLLAATQQDVAKDVLRVPLSNVESIVVKTRLEVLKHGIPPSLIDSLSIGIVDAATADKALLYHGSGQVDLLKQF